MWGREGLYGRPVLGCDRVPSQVSIGNRTWATIKDFAGECEHYAMVPVHRATARDRPYDRGPGKPTHPCIVGAGLAPALPRCTRSFIRQQSLKALPAAPHHPRPYGW